MPNVSMIEEVQRYAIESTLVMVAHVTVGGEAITVEATDIHQAISHLAGEPVAGQCHQVTIAYESIPVAKFLTLPVTNKQMAQLEAIREKSLRYNAENETPAAYLDFQKAVCEARPDLNFTFDPWPAFQAKWMFPGARFGGSAMWTHGTRKLGWGIAQVDLDAWREYEESCEREPRYT